MRYAPFALLLVACGDPGGAADGGDPRCPPTIDGGTLRASSAGVCVYTCTSDAAYRCGGTTDAGLIIETCTFLAIDPLNCGRCGHSCNGGTCVGGVCR